MLVPRITTLAHLLNRFENFNTLSQWVDVALCHGDSQAQVKIHHCMHQVVHSECEKLPSQEKLPSKLQ